MYPGPDGSTPMMEGGQLLAGRYRLLDKVGEGGAAEVFRARDQRLDRVVAIKLLRPQFAYDDASRKRFVQEAKTAAAMAHPNIVDIYDFGEAQDGSMFIAMQFVQGQNLKDLIQKRGRLTPAEAVSIARQACYALAVAHAQGLIHRDVKPQNILIDKSGHISLTDFGIVKALQGPSLTQSGMTFGTAAYMSPEQATGARITPAADLYSLGCVMYEMLSGIPPFTGDNPAVVAYKQVWEQPRPLHELVPEAPPSLENIVMRLLNKDPERRYASAQELVAELDALNLTANQPTQAVAVTGTGLRGGARNPLPAELGQAVQMPAPAAKGYVPPARVGTAGPHTPPPFPAATQPTARPQTQPQPAYAAVPYSAADSRRIEVNVTRRRGAGWIPAAVALLVGLSLCGVGLWQGRNLLGAFGGGASTPTPSSTAVVAQLPNPTATIKLPPIVQDTPSLPSSQPQPSNTPLPSTATATSTDTPAPPPIDTPAPAAPTDTPVPLPPTVTPLPPTEPPAPTEAPPTPTQVPPTEAPAPTLIPPFASEAPTQEPPIFSTAEPQSTSTPAPPPPAGTGNRVDLEDSSFKGGYTNGKTKNKYHNTTAQWVYGRGTSYSSMTASFTVENPPQGAASLTVRGLDSEDPAKTPILVQINGATIYNGPDPLPNDFRNGINGPGNWGNVTWAVPPGVLVAGGNTLTFANLDPSNQINYPIFFMLDYAFISW